jgi:hypothetical protein
VAVIASFEHPERLVAAWGELPRIAGEEAAATAEVRSSTPLPHAVGEAMIRGRGPSGPILLCAIVGAILGGATALAVVLGTEAKWNLSVGGMGGVAGPPTGILAYEGAALGLVLCTVAGVLWFGGLLRRPPEHEPLDHELAAGRVLLRVEALAIDPAELERFFRERGAVEVARTGAQAPAATGVSAAPSSGGGAGTGARAEPP